MVDDTANSSDNVVLPMIQLYKEGQLTTRNWTLTDFIAFSSLKVTIRSTYRHGFVVEQLNPW
ncbi:hypothetical protein A2U01_0081143, partial [Trifolium medium]|nr:hypothetical protein [Trifolium medium]